MGLKGELTEVFSTDANDYDYSAIALNAEGTILVCADFDNNLYCFSVNFDDDSCELEPQVQAELDGGIALCMCGSSDENTFFLGDNEGCIYMWNPVKEELEGVTQLEDEIIMDIQFCDHPEVGEMLVFTGTMNEICYWSLKKGEAIASVELPGCGYCLSVQNEYLMCGVEDDNYCIIDLNTPDEIMEGNEQKMAVKSTGSSISYISCCAVDPSGDYFYLGGGGSGSGKGVIIYPDEKPHAFFAQGSSNRPASCNDMAAFMLEDNSALVTVGSSKQCFIWGVEDRSNIAKFPKSSSSRYTSSSTAYTKVLIHPCNELVVVVEGADPSSMLKNKNFRTRKGKIVLLRLEVGKSRGGSSFSSGKKSFGNKKSGSKFGKNKNKRRW
ncbi:hypothetical protein PCE1_000288 [Barthelona sp. PCE]